MRTIAGLRLLAFSIDWLLIVVWGGLLFGTVVVIFGGIPPLPAGPWTAQAIGFFSMTLPVILYFVFCEHSPRQGSIGKRLCGLVVVDESEKRVSLGAALKRNLLKFTPWECGHLMAHQAISSTSDGLPSWVWIPGSLALLCPVWWLGTILLRGETTYERLSKTTVRRTNRATVAGYR